MTKKGIPMAATRAGEEKAAPEPFSNKLAERAIAAVLGHRERVKDSQGKPGGLLDLPKGKRPIIIGDLHACVDHLHCILGHGSNRADLEKGTAYLLFLGDILHDDRTGHMRETDDSLKMLNDVLGLLATYPDRVFYLRGNHDTFDERLRKSGVPQGTVFHDALLKASNTDFVKLVSQWFDALPYVAIGGSFMAVHAGPVRGGCCREEIIDIQRRPDYALQFIWNRVNEFHGTASPKEYCGADIVQTIEKLGLAPGTHFIVGHNPLWNDGGTSGFWQDVIGIKNHHILYSGSGSRAPYLTVEEGALKVEYSKQKEAEVYYYG